MYDPVAGEQFDLIVSNPPFVIGDGTTRFSYRDSGLAGDGIGRALVEGARNHLRPGGTAQLLANWMVRSGTPTGATGGRVGRGRRLRRLGGAAGNRRPGRVRRACGWPMPARTADRTATEPAALRSPSAGSTTLPPTRVRGIGMGLITLRRNRLRQPVRHPGRDHRAGEESPATRRRHSCGTAAWVETTTDAALLATRFQLAPAVILEQRPWPATRGGTTVLRMIRRQGGAGATLQLDEWGQALLAGCTGAAPLRPADRAAGRRAPVPPARWPRAICRRCGSRSSAGCWCRSNHHEACRATDQRNRRCEHGLPSEPWAPAPAGEHPGQRGPGRPPARAESRAAPSNAERHRTDGGEGQRRNRPRRRTAPNRRRGPPTRAIDTGEGRADRQHRTRRPDGQDRTGRAERPDRSGIHRIHPAAGAASRRRSRVVRAVATGCCPRACPSRPRTTRPRTTLQATTRQ